MDLRNLLVWQIECGADEALDDRPRDRLTARPPATRAASAAILEPRAARAAPSSPGHISQAEAIAQACNSLDALRSAMAAFADCPLQHTAIQLVFADGDPELEIMLIGDTPGEAEDRSGRPFSGPGGDLLDRMLQSIGLDRTALRLAYAIPWRPPGNRKPTEHERRLCLPFLHRHVVLARPRRLVLLGGAATAMLLPGSPGAIKLLRGRWQPIIIPGLEAPIEALPTHALDHLLVDRAARQAAWADLLELRLALDRDAAERR